MLYVEACNGKLALRLLSIGAKFRVARRPGCRECEDINDKLDWDMEVRRPGRRKRRR